MVAAASGVNDVTQPTTNRRGRRSSRSALTREQISAVALDLLTKRGIDAFSIRDLAKELGVYPTAIYHHMETKNDLLADVVSFALRELQPPPAGQTWQNWFRELFGRYREAVQAYPAIAPLMGARIVSNAGVGPDLIESILSKLVDAGFRDDGIVEAFNTVIAAKVGFVTLELAPQPDEAAGFKDMMRARVNTVNVATHPNIARLLPLLSNRAFMLRWENGTTVPLDTSFRTYVDVVIAGLERAVARA